MCNHGDKKGHQSKSSPSLRWNASSAISIIGGVAIVHAVVGHQMLGRSRTERWQKYLHVKKPPYLLTLQVNRGGTPNFVVCCLRQSHWQSGWKQRWWRLRIRHTARKERNHFIMKHVDCQPWHHRLPIGWHLLCQCTTGQEGQVFVFLLLKNKKQYR